MAAICLYELINPFVELSFGKQYLFPNEVVLIFRDSLGLFWHDRYKAIAEALLNLIISIILVRQMGVLGVFLGTLISMLATSVWVEPYVLYKYEFQMSCMGYFVRYLIYVLVIGAAWLGTDVLCAQITGNCAAVLIGRMVVSVLVPNLSFLAVYARTAEFTFLMGKAKQLLKMRRSCRIRQIQSNGSGCCF